MKKLSIFTALILAALTYYAYTLPTQNYPYTYIIEKQHYPRIRLAEDSHVLIVGDRLGHHMSDYIPQIQSLFGQTFSRPVKVFNWSQPKEGIHRTLDKIKSLRRFPPVIVYMGGSEEFLEKLVHIEDYNKIQKSFESYHNAKINRWVSNYPWLSKFFYYLPNFVHLDEYHEYLKILSPKQQLQQKELHLSLYGFALEEMARKILSQKSELIVVVPPIDLLSKPEKNCLASTNDKLENELNLVEKIQKQGKLKDSLTLLELIMRNTLANARAWYIYGKTFLELGRLNMAISALEKANAYNCNDRKASILINKVMKKMAQEQSVITIDFYSIVNRTLGEKENFTPEKMPEESHFNYLIEELEEKIAPLL